MCQGGGEETRRKRKVTIGAEGKRIKEEEERGKEKGISFKTKSKCQLKKKKNIQKHHPKVIVASS